MKVLLGLTIILGGILTTQNSFAVQPGVTGSSDLQVSGPTIYKPDPHLENTLAAKDLPCKVRTDQLARKGNPSGGLDGGKIVGK